MKTEKELRDLEVWIWKHIFKGMTISKKFGKCIAFKLRDERGEYPNGGGRWGWGWQNSRESALSCVPKYTSDNSSAMVVLEKCACEITNLEIDFRDGNKFAVGTYRRSSGCIEAVSYTLPLAICLFAKQLFSK